MMTSTLTKSKARWMCADHTMDMRAFKIFSETIKMCAVTAGRWAPSAVTTNLALKHLEDTTCAAQRLYCVSVATTGFLWVVEFHLCNYRIIMWSRKHTTVAPKLFIINREQWVLNVPEKWKSQYEMHSTWTAAAVGVFVWTTYCRPAPGSCGAACMDSASLPSSATHSQSVSSAQTSRTPTAATNRSPTSIFIDRFVLFFKFNNPSLLAWKHFGRKRWRAEMIPKGEAARRPHTEEITHLAALHLLVPAQRHSIN